MSVQCICNESGCSCQYCKYTLKKDLPNLKIKSLDLIDNKIKIIIENDSNVDLDTSLIPRLGIWSLSSDPVKHDIFDIDGNNNPQRCNLLMV